MNKYAPNVPHVSTQNARKRSEFCFRNATFAYLASRNFWRSILGFCIEKVHFWCIFINISGREWPEAYPWGLYCRESFRGVSSTSPGIFRPFGAIPGTVGSKMSILKFLKKKWKFYLPPCMHTPVVATLQRPPQYQQSIARPHHIYLKCPPGIEESSALRIRTLRLTEKKLEVDM